MHRVPGPAAAAAVVVLSAVPPWQFRNWQWIALALAVPVVLAGLRSARARPDTAGLLTAVGTLAALAWSAWVLVDGGAGVPGLVQPAGAPVLALDAAVVLAVLLLLRDTDAGRGRPATAVAALVAAAAVAALGFRLGAGDPVGALGTSAAVLVAGAPAALLVLPRVPDPTTRVVVAASHGPGVLRAAGALHTAVGGDDPVGRAVADAAGRRHRSLPGVSDADGDPATGLRGVLSEFAAPDVVVAHAVLTGPPDWLRAHGVEPTAGAAQADGQGATVWCVAWDGVARGWLELATAPPPGTRRRGLAAAVALGAAALGAVAAAAGALPPANAGALPAGVALLVAAVRLLPLPDGERHRHPIGATSR
ncbi:hypothetical protein I4I73_05400 [Pseudonocardia sp. KRD-184]|uniref:Uncharacterized protein n=1 Tax=Pseudonocardia oceani TaxID=2792013 RepID=A0ABS6UC50_9PSEU|nr:hypothetical protein [Pseudonocardia oceani]MBW0088516.1 hypothetical protein [Pseudonocardia oceani]MBW0095430.1 hypothetical protein [Pseudonocardia oceani]MBW0108087.1 hypothetical protein [Pseudonocardia oceani]MBW0122017.1 hypothetical protein [Pseudonocardia oceani]MBW0129797.1 hypothetical protein [Pseudonocardia oceani]